MAEPFLPGLAVALRDDATRCGAPGGEHRLRWPPNFARGFFLVPRHGAMEES